MVVGPYLGKEYPLIVSATGPGNRGTLDQGVSKLVLSQATGPELKQLLLLLEELVDGNIGFWTPLMWAARNNKLTDRELKILETIIERVKEPFETFARG